MSKALGSRTEIITPDDFEKIDGVFREMVQERNLAFDSEEAIALAERLISAFSKRHSRSGCAEADGELTESVADSTPGHVEKSGLLWKFCGVRRPQQYQQYLNIQLNLTIGENNRVQSVSW